MKIREHHPLEPVTEPHFVVEVSMRELTDLLHALAMMDNVIANNIRATESSVMIEAMRKRRVVYWEMMDTILEAIHAASGPRNYKED